MDEKGLERRLCQRFSIEGATVSYRKQKLLRFLMKVDEENCPVLDLTRGGIRFLNQQPLKFDSKVSVELFTPGEPIPISLKGRVRWSVPNAGKSYRYQVGVQFNAYGPEADQNAPDLLERLAALEEKFVVPGDSDGPIVPDEIDAR